MIIIRRLVSAAALLSFVTAPHPAAGAEPILIANGSIFVYGSSIPESRLFVEDGCVGSKPDGLHAAFVDIKSVPAGETIEIRSLGASIRSGIENDPVYNQIAMSNYMIQVSVHRACDPEDWWGDTMSGYAGRSPAPGGEWKTLRYEVMPGDMYLRIVQLLPVPWLPYADVKFSVVQLPPKTG